MLSCQSVKSSTRSPRFITLRALQFAMNCPTSCAACCGSLWKKTQKFTAKSIALRDALDYCDDASVRTLYRRCQRTEEAEKDAIGHRGTLARTPLCGC